MNATYNDLLAVVRADISAIEPKVARLKRHLEPLMTELVRLRDIEGFLVAKSASVKPVSSVTSSVTSEPLPTIPAIQTASSESIAVIPQQATNSLTESVTAGQIMTAAVAAARTRGPGGWIRADHVAKRIIGDYDAEKDGRAFVNRIFSLISRRKDLFKRVARGKFALREFVDQHPDAYPDEMLNGTAHAAG